MFETIFIILICVLLLGSFGDLIFDFLGFGVRLFLSFVLIIASVWLALKLFVVMVPWMFIIACIAFIVGVIWLLRTIFKR